MENEYSSVQELAGLIRSGMHIVVHGAAATPDKLLEAIVDRAEELENITFYHIHTEGFAGYTDDQYVGTFSTNAFFIGKNIRKAIQHGNAQYIPAFLSDIPYLIRKEIIPVDTLLLHLSEPDRHGYCTLGPTVVEMPAAIEKAELILAIVNSKMPRTHGDSYIHIKQLDGFVRMDNPIHCVEAGAISEQETKIGHHIASLVEDGATLQMGIGGIPDAALKALSNHKHLGVHTEMFSDSIIDLIESGVIDNSQKTVYPDHTVTSFAMGSQRLYDFIDDNPSINFLDCSFTNDVVNIRSNPKATAINSAIEIDLTGQVCADSIGNKMYSGVGGQMDFIRGAALSQQGKPIIALGSVTGKGESKITSCLKPGAGVVSTRGHVQYIVTEYGIVDLRGKNLKQRAKALIGIAHPDHREALTRDAYHLYH